MLSPLSEILTEQEKADCLLVKGMPCETYITRLLLRIEEEAVELRRLQAIADAEKEI